MKYKITAYSSDKSIHYRIKFCSRKAAQKVLDKFKIINERAIYELALLNLQPLFPDKTYEIQDCL